MVAVPTSRRLVDVVIPTYDNRDGLLECLAQLDDPAIAEVIVVDDVSSDDTADAVRRAFPGVRVLELAEHRGVAHAINAGAAAGEAEFVLLFNDDVLADASSVSDLVAALRREPNASCAAGRLVDVTTGKTQDSYRPRHLPTVGTLAARLSGLERALPGNRWSGQHLRAALPDTGTVTTSQQAAGACFLLPRSLFDAIGGLDEDFWFGYEDTDFARRLLARGPLVWVGDATFRHVGMRSLQRWRRDQWHARLHYGTLLYAQRHFSRLGAAAVGLMVVGLSIPRLIWATLPGRRGTTVYRRLISQAFAVIRGRTLRLEIPAGEARRRPPRGGLPTEEERIPA